MQAENHQERSDVDERARVGPAYVKFWHQGIRQLFDACCLLYDKTPDELCDVLNPLMVEKGISPDDRETIRLVLLRHSDLSLEAGKRMAKRYEGQAPLIDCLSELLEAHQEG